MEEEKKNNKGLMIGIIIFLIIGLIAIFYFMFKMTYVGNKTSNDEKEQIQTETAEKNEVLFTELTKYELQEGEEKEVIVDGKKIKVKVEKETYYLKDIEVGKIVNNSNDLIVYVTNNLIICPYFYGQSGYQYYVNDLDGKKINVEYPENEINQYVNIRLKNNRIFVDLAQIGDGPCTNESQCFFDKIDTLCKNEKNKDIKEYSSELEKYKNDSISKTYEIKYDGNEVTIEKADDINTIEKWIETYDKVCLREE